ncbi:MAG: glycosyltransferase family 1 protein, partial [Candidatus Firestonebacteria bacterium]|nr:glycosyltransferase family 1 protein [Candidatus Firestonebacteria bacterium]
TGFTFTPGDVVDLREKIKLLLFNKTLISIMGKNARKIVEEELNQEKYYNTLMMYYKEIIEKHKK